MLSWVVCDGLSGMSVGFRRAMMKESVSESPSASEADACRISRCNSICFGLLKKLHYNTTWNQIKIFEMYKVYNILKIRIFTSYFTDTVKSNTSTFTIFVCIFRFTEIKRWGSLNGFLRNSNKNGWDKRKRSNWFIFIQILNTVKVTLCLCWSQSNARLCWSPHVAAMFCLKAYRTFSLINE